VNQSLPHLCKPNLVLRGTILRAIRQFFFDQAYLEVETPHRIPAPAPETHIKAPPSGDWFLHTSPELCMKRLLAAGHDRLFQICRCFRDGERGDRHLPEFTMLEWYRARADYTDLMDDCEGLITCAASAAGASEHITYQGRTIDLSLPWLRMSVAEAFRRYTDTSVDTALAQDRFDELVGCTIEPQLGHDKPVFLYDYPASLAALARIHPDNPGVAQRFELYMGGLELANAFTELTDPAEQRRRFEEERGRMQRGGGTVYPMPEPFLNDLAAMPPAAGIALGLDRLVMLLADADTIDSVVAFTPEEL
jgi:lysyl-tRNA synthetase class 2